MNKTVSFYIICTMITSSMTGMDLETEINTRSNTIQAIQTGDTETVKTHINDVDDANATFMDTSLLIWAIDSNQTGITRMLIDYGADVNAAHDLIDRTPLHSAIDAGNDEVMTLLLHNKAHINTESSVVPRPVMYAAYVGNISAAKILINADADITGTDHNGNTILHHSTQWTCFNELIPYFIAHTAHHLSSTPCNKQQQTPATIAREHGNHDAAHIMRRTFAIENVFTPDQKHQPKTRHATELRKRITHKLNYLARKQPGKKYSTIAQQGKVRTQILPRETTHCVLQYML